MRTLQVAMLCPEKGELASKLFHNKFLSSSGEHKRKDHSFFFCTKNKMTGRQVNKSDTQARRSQHARIYQYKYINCEYECRNMWMYVILRQMGIWHRPKSHLQEGQGGDPGILQEGDHPPSYYCTKCNYRLVITNLEPKKWSFDSGF